LKVNPVREGIQDQSPALIVKPEREAEPPLWLHWMKFNAVSLIGVGVQLLVLQLLVSGFSRLDLRLATFLAVEVAILHNFAWHEIWTWADRTRNSSGASRLRRLMRFHLSAGLVSIIGNVIITDALVRGAMLSVITANAIAIALCYVANFCLSHWFAFRRPS